MNEKKLTAIETECFEYLFESELDDYLEQCRIEELTPYIVDKQSPKHICESAAIALFERGFDLEGWIIK